MGDYGHPMFPAGYPIQPGGSGAIAPPGYPDHGDGIGEYYGLDQLYKEQNRTGRKSHGRNTHLLRDGKRSRSTSSSESLKTRTLSRSRTHSHSHTSSRSRSRSRTRSITRSKSRSPSGVQPVKGINYKQPSVLDAFRIMYLTPSKHSRSTSKYLATKKKQDRIQEFLKSDGLGSKKWLFYPRTQISRSDVACDAAGAKSCENCDRRIKIDADFFRKYKKDRKIANDAPIAKLKRWELTLYKRLGFIHAV